MDIIFCRIGWMISYNGAVSEKPQNGGSYNINHIGHETYNFPPWATGHTGCCGLTEEGA